MRFIHSADWQIGARFGRFGVRAQRLREARLRTFRKALQVAHDRAVDTFLVAGDLFEDHQVEPAAIRGIYQAIQEFPSVRVYVLPGNHDPASGPAAIWARVPFSQPLPNLKIFTKAEAVELGDSAWLLASPLTQKRSTIDPSQQFVEMARALPGGAIKIGLTHGALAIGGMHAPDDFPIAVNAASRAGLDFLGIGHWHSSLLVDDGRLLMPGTPEPTAFDENGSGHVHLVEIPSAGAVPKVDAIRVAEFPWLNIVSEGLPLEETTAKVKAMLVAHTPASSVVARVTLRGEYPEDVRLQLASAVEALLADCAIGDIRDETASEASSEEEDKARVDHPLLGEVLDDLAALAGTSGNTRFAEGELADLCRRMSCEAADLTPEVALAARKLLLGHLRECEKAC